MQMEVGALIDQPPEHAFSAEDAYLAHAWTKAKAEVW
jgi:hypothetical protein